MRKPLILFGLVLAAIVTIAAYPYIQVDAGKILITDGKIQFAAAGLSWTEVEGLPAARSYLAAATLGTNIYAIGGYDGGAKTNVYKGKLE